MENRKSVMLDDDDMIAMDGAVTARDIQLAHGIWKRDGSSDPGGQLWQKMLRGQHDIDVNRLGVKWFENLRFSSSRKSKISVRPRGTRPVPPVDPGAANSEATDFDRYRTFDEHVQIQANRGLTHRTGKMAHAALSDFDAETYEYAKNETVSNFAADGIQLIDGGERVGFKQALKDHDQLTQDGHKNMAQTLDQAADAHDDGEIDEAAQRQIEQWYREHEDVAKSAFENAADADTFVDNLASLGCNRGGEN